MTSQDPDHVPEEQPANGHRLICKRPGCGNPLPVTGRTRGRARQFCCSECARRYHNDARIPAPKSAVTETDDPLAALDTLIRHLAVLTRAAREQVAGLDKARVRAQLAEAEAARRRAEAAAAATASQAAHARSQIQELTAEIQALTQALDAARAEVARLARRGQPGGH
jgi:hypothetical protein